MGVKRVFVDRGAGQVIRIGLEAHVKPGMSVGKLFSRGMVEVMVARVEQGEAKLMVTATEDFQITFRDTFPLISRKDLFEERKRGKI